MKALNKVVWGIIGAGDVCEKKSAPAMSMIQSSRVKMIMRRNSIKAEDFAKRHNIPYWTTNEEEIFNDPEINAVYIATPPDSHAYYTTKAAQTGKAVYVEKPMAINYEQCLSMIKACHTADVPLFTAYYRRTLPGFLKVKEIIENGLIGDIRFVSIEMIQPLDTKLIADTAVNWRIHPEISGGGYFHDLASHELDFLDFLFGPITNVSGISENQANLYPADDIVTANFKFENGVVGNGMWCFSSASESQKDEIKILGSKGELSFNCFGNPMVINLCSAYNEKEEFRFSHDQPIQKDLIQLIVDELTGKGECPSTGVSGARTSRILDLITKKD